MDTDEHRWEGQSSELTFLVIGCAMEVLNEMGHGLHERPYENALAVEFSLRHIPFSQQERFEITYKSKVVGEFVPDLLVGDDVVVDTKVVPKITDHERGQMLNYLRITKRRVGLILNFHKSKLEWHRLVL